MEVWHVIGVRLFGGLLKSDVKGIFF